MIIVKEKKMKKAFVCIRSKKVRMNTRLTEKESFAKPKKKEPKPGEER